MHAYVDETGNTGLAIFDKTQPLFITAAMITKSDFDLLRGQDLARVAAKVGQPALHAAELGTAKIELVAKDLLKLVKAHDARFVLCRVEKRFLAASKVFDTYFDGGENLAVPWAAYNLRHLRMTLVFKIAACILDEEVARTVWEGITSDRADKSVAVFVKAAREMLNRVERVPDERSREIIRDAMEWAIANPENFSVHTKDKVNRLAHSPNLVAFVNLLTGVERASKAWGRSCTEIVHDRQSQFERTFRQYHELVSNASPEVIEWPGEPPISMRNVPGSRLRVATEKTSPGLQVIDVVLWLFKRVIAGHEVGPNAAKLLHRVYARAWQNDFSFNGVGNQVERQLDDIMDRPMSEEQLQLGRDMVAHGEERRKAVMRQYATTKAGVAEPGG